MKIAVISSHPDDETLGCGGTLLKHIDNNDEIYWIIITGMLKDDNCKKNIIERAKQIDLVGKKYGIKNKFELNYPAANLDNIPIKKIIGDIAKIFKQIIPDIIYLPNRSDIHSDHRVTFDATISCTKSFRYPSIRKVLMYETLSETEFTPPLPENGFQPNCYSDISNFMEEKIEIMKIYESEIGDHPFPRSEENIRALATYRGAVAGVKYAEAFMILKEIF